MNKVKTLAQVFTGATAAATLFCGKVLSVYADEVPVRDGAEAAKPDGVPTDLFGDTGVFNQVTNIILLIVGLISVIMLLYGGLRYVISGGDSKKVTDAKNTILYAIIGLIVAILAYAIVNFVLSAIGVPSLLTNVNS